jgi:hypothetical protein
LNQSWFHMGLETTRSNVWRRLPARNFGFLNVSPISMVPSMSWMIMFMFAMAQVVATYSWPCIFSGAYLVLLRSFIRVSSTCSQGIKRPAEPQQGS